MKKLWSFCLILIPVLFMTGCGDKFEPTESTVFVTSKGIVKSAVMESFDEEHYSFAELSQEVDEEVNEYCQENGAETVIVDSLTEDAGTVTLMMTYQSAEDYETFNDLLLFSGTVSEAIEEGWHPETLLDRDGQPAELDEEKSGELKILVTEENICVQTSGKIRYVSDNVTVRDKKMAKVMEAGKTHPAFIIYK